jgi:hypothetical protein
VSSPRNTKRRGHLYNTWQSEDEAQSKRFIKRLQTAGLKDVAKALRNDEKLWWLDDVQHRILIKAVASPASGSGWSLYDENPDWFLPIMEHLRKAVDISNRK